MERPSKKPGIVNNRNINTSSPSIRRTSWGSQISSGIFLQLYLQGNLPRNSPDFLIFIGQNYVTCPCLKPISGEGNEITMTD